jgi:hypothetical protein
LGNTAYCYWEAKIEIFSLGRISSKNLHKHAKLACFFARNPASSLANYLANFVENLEWLSVCHTVQGNKKKSAKRRLHYMIKNRNLQAMMKRVEKANRIRDIN